MLCNVQALLTVVSSRRHVYLDQGKLMYNANSLGYTGEPRPVTGSQPFAAKKPVVLQLGFEPTVMSVKTCGFAYCKTTVSGMRFCCHNTRGN
jgi:hypothetical protein